MNKQRVQQVAQWLFEDFGIRPNELQPIYDNNGKDMQEAREQEQIRKQLALLWAEAEAE